MSSCTACRSRRRSLGHASWPSETGAIFIHPFDHADVIAGQGTVGLEIGEQCPQARTIVVPVGGGGLCSGVAVATSSVLPAARLIGVQAEAVAPVPASIAAGHPVSVMPSATMADGIAVRGPRRPHHRADVAAGAAGC